MMYSALKYRSVNMLLHWKCKYKERFSFFWTSRFQHASGIQVASKKSHLSVIFRNSFRSATAKLYFDKNSYLIWHIKSFRTLVSVSCWFSPFLTLLLDHDRFCSRKKIFLSADTSFLHSDLRLTVLRAGRLSAKSGKF
jgi:hypothetical protein